VLFAINQPVAMLGLILAFLAALALRLAAMRLAARATGLQTYREPLRLNPREDIDPFGAVCALMVGTGWGRPVDIAARPRRAGRGRRAFVVAVGPLVPLAVGVLVLVAYRLLWHAPVIGAAGDLLRGGWAPSLPAEFVLAVAAGLIGFGVFNILPLPPLDGFHLMWVSMKHIGAAGERARATLVENNIGVVILLVIAFFPLNYPFVYLLLDLLAAPLLWVFG
jgi:hypothetical protein